MSIALAFDIYGTLIDPHGVVGELRTHLGDGAAEFSRVWREKQLEYTWRRGLMRCYQNFGVCTRQALDYADEFFATGLDDSVKQSLMLAYRELPAYADVRASLATLKQGDRRLYPFSNGTAEMVDAVLQHAAIDSFFEDVISVDSLHTFKPNPEVYQHVIRIADLPAENCWLVSSNAFDVIGAVSAGMKAAWLKRFDGVVYDPWEIEPTCIIRSLEELPAVLD